jgi:ABC-type transport system substrate-binding protein
MTSLLQKLIFIFLGGLLMIDPQALAANLRPFRYVITETAGPSSLDPLEADSTSNLPVARMIYSTPLETSDTNQLISRVLESFKYDSASRKIEWIVKPSAHYEDGTQITADDIAFAVARMAYTRPLFPVIDAIEGVETWSQSKEALKGFPKGIQVAGNKITIQLTKDVDHPLFRFCLELFSVIPRKCVDLATNKISCKKIPESGSYKIMEQDQKSILFAKRDIAADKSAPAQIRFEYVSSADLAKHLHNFDDQTVVAGNESFFTPAGLKELESKMTLRFTPAARFSVIQINQHVPPFQDKKCRQVFAQSFRSAYHELFKDAAVEGSIFTKILPGYLPLKDLESANSLSAKDVSECKDKLAKSTIPWGYAETEKDAVFFQVLKFTFDKLGIKSTAPITKPTRKDFSDIFSEGKVAFFNAGSGFWALDPAGDMKMLFTPNLHKPLKHISDDEKLQMLIGKLGTGAAAYTETNRYLYEESRFNVYTHLRRFFATKNKSILAEVPFAITSPAPWQVFKVL